MGLILAPLALAITLLTIWIGRKNYCYYETTFANGTSCQSFGYGDFSERITISSEDEIGRLGKAFNKMANSLETEDVKRKEF